MQRSSHASKRNQCKATREPENASVRFLKDIGKSFLCSLAIAPALLLVASLVAYFLEDPKIAIPPLGLLCSALTAFLGGLLAIRIHRRGALVCGFCNGALLSLVMLLASLFFRTEASGYSALLSALLHVGFLLLSVGGAFAGLPRQGQKARRRKRS